MEDKIFTWTPELTHRLFQLRFENNWLFKKKKQPWKEFRNILLQNGFPEEMSLGHVRKKWSYTYDCYKIAKKTKNKKWLYYKLFDKHFRKNKALDRYESWNDEWRLKLVNSITQAKVNSDDHNLMWRIVERDLRAQKLPIDCCIQDIEALWQYLQTTFNRKYRIKLKKGSELSEWSLYDTMLQYYQTFEQDLLSKLEEEGYVCPRIRNTSTNYCNKIKRESENNENEDFQWSRDVTESFIQLRLQHEWLFRERKWAWNDLAEIMVTEYDFPKYLTGRMMCHKWSSTYGDYQKAKATNNTNWVYYNLFELYLGEGTLSLDPVRSWSEEWIHNFINIRSDLESYFREVERPNIAWREVEIKLRNEGLPLDHSLLELPKIWMQLTKTYKWKRKFANKGILNENWPFYEAMLRYTEIRNQQESTRYKNIRTVLSNFNDDVDMNNDDCEDDLKLFDLKKRLQTKPKFEILEANCCRACGNEGACVNLYEPYDENGINLAYKLKLIGGIEVDKTDSLPHQICFTCLRELENAYNFRRKCQELDSQYRTIKDSESTVKIEVNVKYDGNEQTEETLHNTIVGEKMEDYRIQDGDVFENDNVESNDAIGEFKEETKDLAKKTARKKILSKRVLKSRKKYTYDYTRVCEVCGKRTRNIKNHMDSHATEKLYNCEQCDKKFKFKSGLVIHRAVHNPTPRKTCEVCGKTFHVLAQYRKHFVYHVNERKFTCETCGKAFHTKEILTVHMRMHTDERPFSCPECGKTFRTAGCVSRHKRIVHKKLVKT